VLQIIELLNELQAYRTSNPSSDCSDPAKRKICK